MPAETTPTRLYANRAMALLIATIPASMCVAIWIAARQQDSAALTLYDTVLKVLIVSAGWLAFGSATLLMLLWTVAWFPLIELDERGMRWRQPLWRVPPLKPVEVAWRDVRTISACKEVDPGPNVLNHRHLKLTFHMKHAATITHHVPRDIDLTVSPLMVRMSADSFRELVNRYKHVTDADTEFVRLNAQHRAQVEREASGRDPPSEARSSVEDETQSRL